ncbi:MAG: molybdopterin molybdotransferase MoeA [Solirubrobacterales bacterium]|nr:molybdopterin molybdotransferase MoeA [Solirubrobacterales bacterium]
MITVEEHLDRVLAATSPLPTETVALSGAGGLCLAEDTTAICAVPPWTNSAMDGYAVRFTDVAAASAEDPVELTVVADLPAGSDLRPSIGPGQAARIMTGAPVPPDADAVVPVELTDGGVRKVTVNASPGERRHIRKAGEDRQPGDPVVPGGTVAGPEVISSLASTGHREILVHRRPRVAVIATGDELVDPGSELRYGRIPDSNSLLIAGLARESGAEVTAVQRVGDTGAELASAIERCLSADLVVLSGGVSVGAHDPVKALFAGGNEVRFDRVAMQPGKPQAFGRLAAGPLLFGLPGNPVSVWVSFHVFVRPCLRKLRGLRESQNRPLPARALTGWRVPEGRAQYLPAVIGTDADRRTVAPAASGGSGSHLVASLAAANGFAIVPPRSGPVETGDVVATVLTGPEPATVGAGPDRTAAKPRPGGESSA